MINKHAVLEQIKVSAFNNEFEKIAMSATVISKALAKAKQAAFQASDIKSYNKYQKNAINLFSGLAKRVTK